MMTDRTRDIPVGRQLLGLRGCEILTGVFSDRVFPKHSHEGLMLSAIAGGTQRVVGSGVNITAAAGQIIAVAPDEAHVSSPGPTGWWRYCSLMVPAAAAAEVLDNCDVAVRIKSAIEDTELTAGIHSAAEAIIAEELLTAQHRLGLVLTHFLQRYGALVSRRLNGGREQRAVRMAREYLASRLDRTVSLADLSREVGMEGARLTRAFAASVGLPPHAWHLQIRLREGQDALARGEGIASVAAATGFADQAHFTRRFHRLVGVTPGVFRDQHLPSSSSSD